METHLPGPVSKLPKATKRRPGTGKADPMATRRQPTARRKPPIAHSEQRYRPRTQSMDSRRLAGRDCRQPGINAARAATTLEYGVVDA